MSCSQQRRRVRLRAQGLCRDCGQRKRLKGVGRTGWPYTRCRRCIDQLARGVAVWQAERLRSGRCVSCPRRKQRGDEHWECPRCREIRNDKRRAREQRAAA